MSIFASGMKNQTNPYGFKAGGLVRSCSIIRLSAGKSSTVPIADVKPNKIRNVTPPTNFLASCEPSCNWFSGADNEKVFYHYIPTIRFRYNLRILSRFSPCSSKCMFLWKSNKFPWVFLSTVDKIMTCFFE